MPMYGGRFEALTHEIDGRKHIVPLLLNADRHPSHEYTVPLLEAAEVIAPDYDTPPKIAKLVGKVGVLLSSTAVEHGVLEGTMHDGLSIESNNGFGSLLVMREDVTVAIRENPPAKVPTDLFFDMLQKWNQFLEGPQPTA